MCSTAIATTVLPIDALAKKKKVKKSSRPEEVHARYADTYAHKHTMYNDAEALPLVVNFFLAATKPQAAFIYDPICF